MHWILNKIGSFQFSNIEISPSVGKFLILIFAVVVMSFLINMLLSQTILGIGYRIFVAPGIILHELSHALLCLLTGAKISKISFFDRDGGEVKHSASSIPIVGQVLISIAPFFFGAMAIYFCSRKLGISGIDLGAIDVSKVGFLHYFTQTISNLKLDDYKTYIILYLVISIAVTMTPSWQDLRNIFLSAILILIISYFLIHYKVLYLSSIVVPQTVFTLFSVILFLLILAFIFSIIMFVLSKLIKPN
jgi:hypothetical protein